MPGTAKPINFSDLKNKSSLRIISKNPEKAKFVLIGTKEYGDLACGYVKTFTQTSAGGVLEVQIIGCINIKKIHTLKSPNGDLIDVTVTITNENGQKNESTSDVIFDDVPDVKKNTSGTKSSKTKMASKKTPKKSAAKTKQ